MLDSYCDSIEGKLEASGLSCVAYQYLDEALLLLSYVRDGRCEDMLGGMDKLEVLGMAEGFIADVKASL